MISASVSKRSIQLLQVAALSLFLGAADDPRPDLIDLQLQGDFAKALDEVDQNLGSHPTLSRAWGLDYLRGHLLDHLERKPEAIEAFTAAMTSVPLLESYGRYRLAIDRFESNRPQMAAGLLAPLLANGPPEPLADDAISLMNRSITAGGDCRLLDSSDSWSLDRAQSRRLLASKIACDPAQDPSPATIERWKQVLQADRADETARRAAHRLADAPLASLDSTASLLVGLTFFDHREFSRAIPYLESSLEELTISTRGIRGFDRDDVLYAIARSYYWLGDYPNATERFSQVAYESDDPAQAARALFQRGRSFALAGDWEQAIESYHAATEANPSGSWAAAALISAMRLEWRQGREESALELFGRLRSLSRWRSSIERAALFLAVSDLVKERTDRAAAWLAIARRAARGDRPEIWYWRGRHAELLRENRDAAVHYAALIGAHPYHPLSQAARGRLQDPALNEAAVSLAKQYARSSRTRDLQRARVLLDVTHPEYQSASEALVARWRRNSTTRPLIEGATTAPQEWPLWQAETREPESLLLTLGIVEAYSGAVRRSFPLADTDLALSGSRLMAASGLYRRSLYYAEVVARRVPKDLPQSLLAVSFRRLLFPRPYEFQIEQQARRFGVEPNLLRAIIREESRFNPMAVSGASARGLTQFVLSTARRVGLKLGWQDFDTWDLHDPEIAITLGAAYLAELERGLDGLTLPVLAAYNAGEDQARLWQSYCFSREPEEYFTKVGYRQTRGYLEKVLSSRAQYREIYAEGVGPYPAFSSSTSTTGGNES